MGMSTVADEWAWLLMFDVTPPPAPSNPLYGLWIGLVLHQRNVSKLEFLPSGRWMMARRRMLMNATESIIIVWSTRESGCVRWRCIRVVWCGAPVEHYLLPDWGPLVPSSSILLRLIRQLSCYWIIVEFLFYIACTIEHAMNNHSLFISSTSTTIVRVKFSVKL